MLILIGEFYNLKYWLIDTIDKDDEGVGIVI